MIFARGFQTLFSWIDRIIVAILHVGQTSPMVLAGPDRARQIQIVLRQFWTHPSYANMCSPARGTHENVLSNSRHVQRKLGYECNSGVGRYYVENIQARFHKKTVHYAINE